VPAQNTHPALHNDANGEINAIGAELGTNPSGSATTVAARIAAVEAVAPWTNVVAFGAAGDGATDDTAALQDALDAAVAAGGGTVFLPAGSYVISDTLSIPAGVPIRLVGAAMAMRNVGYPTQIVRAEGVTATMLHVAGDGDTDADRGYVEICDLEFDGATEAGHGVVLERCNEVYLHRTKIRNCYQSGLILRQCWNLVAHAAMVHGCGDHTTHPATLVDAIAAVGGNSDTLLLSNCQWESNGGTDLRITGSTAHSARSSVVQVVNAKMEGAAWEGSFPFVDLHYAQMCHFDNAVFGCPAERSGPFVLQNGESNGWWSNKFSNCHFDKAAGGTAPAHYIDIGAGSIQLDNVACTGHAPTSSYVRVRNTVTARRVQVGQILVEDNTKTLIEDDRADPTVASAATITLPNGDRVVKVTGTTNITSITASHVGRVVTLIFAGALTFTNGSNLKLNTAAGNLVTTGDDTITLVCDGTNWFEVSRSVN
jgi:hypothetical protein